MFQHESIYLFKETLLFDNYLHPLNTQQLGASDIICSQSHEKAIFEAIEDRQLYSVSRTLDKVI